MEIINFNDENSFDPTPRLKSSPIPIKFISFNSDNENCVYCEEKYIGTVLSPRQKYCEKCLSHYVNNITGYNMYLDMCYVMDFDEKIRTRLLQSNEGYCGDRVRILCFKQMNRNITQLGREILIQAYKGEGHCTLCRKLFRTTFNFVLCSNCYLISFEWIESTLVKKQILILYLPWWYNASNCDACKLELTFTSDCQKYCTNCLIFYTGCRYCLTTNIIFGPTDQSRCKKCKRISLIIINIDNDKIRFLDDFLLNKIIYDNLNLNGLANIVKPNNRYFAPRTLLSSIFREKNEKNKVILDKWMSYSLFKDVKKMTKGGYGIIYKATWLNNNKTVILKRFENSENNIKYFLNELESNLHCFNKFDNYIINIYGFTKDPELRDYILVMKYASEGDLHKYLQKNFTNITWNNQKLLILLQITEGLEYIHKNTFVHRDFHSGNILLNIIQWKIGDLGLSQFENNASSNNEIYGVIPYIAPEIFKGSSFSKEADIYSFGMVMWELTTGCKPFANVKHDIHLIYKILDGERPKITEDTPDCYAKLLESCWDSDPKKRPSIKEIRLTLNNWSRENKYTIAFEQAEAKRKKLIESKMIGPEFAEKQHPEAIYTSRPLSALISKCSSMNSTISFGNKQDYNYFSKEQEFDIDIKSSTSHSTSLNKRNNEVLLNLETKDNSGKRIRTS